MTEANTISDSVLEEFRCFQCKNYLSISPIVLLSDGNSLCGICSMSAEETTCRQLTFENFLKTLSYPCKFRDFGCKERLTFGEGQDHEGKCIYRPMICPISLSCSWEGPIQEMFNHFNSSHTNLISKKMKFKLAVCDKDQKGLQLAYVDGVGSIIKYHYSVTTGNLQYVIQHFNTDADEMVAKISLTNDLDMDYTINLKSDPPSLFNNSFCRDFCEIPNSEILALHNLLPVLNNPDCITVGVNLLIVKSDENEKQEMFVDYNLTEGLRCSNCLGYLLPPLYKNPTSGNPMCCYCHNQCTNVKPELNEELLAKVTKTNFPCRWRGCEITKPGADLVEHELSCKLRMFKCPVCADNMITRGDVTSHIKDHGYYYFKNCIIYNNIMLGKEYNVKIFTIKNGNLIYVTCKFGADKHSFTLQSDNEFNNNVIVTVQFEHDHCKTYFKTNMKLPINQAVSVSDLPPCFKNNKAIKVGFRI